MLMGTLLLILLMGSRVQLHLLYDMLVKLTHILEAQITHTLFPSKIRIMGPFQSIFYCMQSIFLKMGWSDNKPYPTGFIL